MADRALTHAGLGIGPPTNLGTGRCSRYRGPSVASLNVEPLQKPCRTGYSLPACHRPEIRAATQVTIFLGGVVRGSKTSLVAPASPLERSRMCSTILTSSRSKPASRLRRRLRSSALSEIVPREHLRLGAPTPSGLCSPTSGIHCSLTLLAEPSRRQLKPN